MKEILQDGNPVLREKAEEVLIKDITKSPIKSLIKDMFGALKGKEYGVALAAPQIGASVRVFVVAEKVFEEDKDKKGKEQNHLVYINPTITKTSKKKSDLEEGCLSVDGFFGTTTRAQQITVGAYDEDGVKFSRGASGLLAQIFQHEIEHLDGILYVDHARNVQKVEG